MGTKADVQLNKDFYADVLEGRYSYEVADTMGMMSICQFKLADEPKKVDPSLCLEATLMSAAFKVTMEAIILQTTPPYSEHRR